MIGKIYLLDDIRLIWIKWYELSLIWIKAIAYVFVCKLRESGGLRPSNVTWSDDFLSFIFLYTYYFTSSCFLEHILFDIFLFNTLKDRKHSATAESAKKNRKLFS